MPPSSYACSEHHNSDVMPMATHDVTHCSPVGRHTQTHWGGVCVPAPVSGCLHGDDRVRAIHTTHTAPNDMGHWYSSYKDNTVGGISANQHIHAQTLPTW
eukprot:m.117091 g.117091  ORF g.117091 m.117091 type:complete len:100 (+) comp17183_c0_seq28:2965-3264(+)